MTKRMLIDTSHAEETRVVVLDGNRLEDYDVETAAKKQLKGNIYLAKVVRVEPSLQAAFVEYGGNRHGFLAFAEIHPDYYQIPVADRQRLIAAQEEEARAEEARAEAEQERAEALAAQRQASRTSAEAEAGDDEATEANDAADLDATSLGDDVTAAQSVEGEVLPPETLDGEDDAPRDAAPRRPRMRHYTIQEVIRRRQILLIQVVKEERGNKGASMTTYISLAGRFCVLMPNSLRDGGVSRKITSAADRRRLKEITAELEIPRGMGMIVRTAGAQRPRAEIKRDCEYLLELWDEIRERTLASIAPAPIHEEASLIRRAIRDGYSRDIEEVLVDGEAGWRSARDFMRTLMPDHARKVQIWQGTQPLFSHHQVEAQLDLMLSPSVQLRSGGYLVINQTEALVAIDVNSGRATRERGIEETAFRTNLEAADEVARQLRLRDLAGLIVIDFIDMESRRHNAAVERKLKEALRDDRARIQVGSISAFGLMEMSRQRLRPSLAETSFSPCPHCGGTGLVRGTDSAALHVLRVIEEEGARRRAAEILVHVASPVALYILNHKRVWLDEIEQRYGLTIAFAADDTMLASQVRIERTRAVETVEADGPAAAAARPAREATQPEQVPARAAPERPRPPKAEADDAGDAVADEPDGSDEDAPQAGGADASAEGGEERRRRRRRRRRGGRRDDVAPVEPDAEQPEVPDHSPYGPAVHRRAPAEADIGAEAPPITASEPGQIAETSEGGTSDERTGEGRTGEGRNGRGRRGGRRHGRDRAERATQTPERETEPSDRASGPTPADPFGGFDIFEVLEGSADQRRGPMPSSVIAALPPVPAAREEQAELPAVADAEPEAADPAAIAADGTATVEVEAEAEVPARRSRRKAAPVTKDEAAAKPRRARGKTAAPSEAPQAASDVQADPPPSAKPARASRSRRKTVQTAGEAPASVPEAAVSIVDTTSDPATPTAEPELALADNVPKPTLIEAGNAPAARRAGWWRK